MMTYAEELQQQILEKKVSIAGILPCVSFLSHSLCATCEQDKPLLTFLTHYLLNIHSLFAQCSLNMHSMFTQCHELFTHCSLPCVFFRSAQNREKREKEEARVKSREMLKDSEAAGDLGMVAPLPFGGALLKLSAPSPTSQVSLPTCRGRM
jgi:hypothetical protein